MREIWKDVVGWEGRYSVSNLGRVRKDITTNNFKLTKSDVNEIKNEYAKGKLTHRELGNKYGVCRATVTAIFMGINWCSTKKRTYAGHILETYTNQDGYLKVDLYDKNKRRNVQVHTLVMEAFIGKRPPDKNVNHKDGVKTNNRLLNLEYITQKENIHHAMKMGLFR